MPFGAYTTLNTHIENTGIYIQVLVFMIHFKSVDKQLTLKQLINYNQNEIN